MTSSTCINTGPSSFRKLPISSLLTESPPPPASTPARCSTPLPAARGPPVTGGGLMGGMPLPLNETWAGRREGLDADRGDPLGPRGAMTVTGRESIQVGRVVSQRHRAALKVGPLVHNDEHRALDADRGDPVIPL